MTRQSKNTSLAFNGALVTAVVLITRRLYRVEAELDRVTALIDAATRRARAARVHSPLPAGPTELAGADADCGSAADLAAEWEQAILPSDS